MNENDALEHYEQNRQIEGMNRIQREKARNNANANAISNAANTLSKTGGVPGAIGKGIKTLDNVTGGRASQALGKKLSLANKRSGLGGRIAQGITNKVGDSGTANRISSATSKRKGLGLLRSNNSPTEAKANLSKGEQTVDAASKDLTESRPETDNITEGGVSFSTRRKIGIALIVSAPIFVIVILGFITIAATQMFLSVTTMGQADSLSENDKEVENKIKKKTDEQLSEEHTDENVSYDIFIDDEDSIKFRNNKLKNSNYVQIATTQYLKRKYNEASLDELEDFYPDVKWYGEKYDTNTAYDFFFKLYYVYKTYRDDYGVYLDLPLLMATLNKQSSDMNVIFESNLSSEDKDPNKRDKEELGYCRDWSSYSTTSTRSEHDIEVLAQHMVSEQVTEYCMDASGNRTQENILKDAQINTPTLTCAEGETYQTTGVVYKKDDEKYEEFLKEFIEKKYYLNQTVTLSTAGSFNCNIPASEGEVVINDGGEIGGSSTYINPSDTGDWRNWRQGKGSWKSLRLPGGETVAKSGCAYVSLCIIIARSGTATTVTPFNPGTALNKFKFDGNNIDFHNSSIQRVAPNFERVNKITLKGRSKESIARQLSTYDPKKFYMVISVPGHYVALDYVDMNTYDLYMIDPAGRGTKLYDHYKPISAFVYEKKD